MANETIVTLAGTSNGANAPRGDKVPQETPAVLGKNDPLVSILIPCCGQLEYTRLCVPSLLRYSRKPFELIFLDIGSLDGTAEYLAGVAAAAGARVEVVRAATDLDIGAACNEAIHQARGEFLVLLNNDTVVTDAWLNQLLALANVSPTFGLVGPMSNYAAPPQLVETVPYRIGPRKRGQIGGAAGSDFLVDVEAVHAFARKHRQDNLGKWVEADHLGGFCLLMRREVLRKIGPLESKEGLGLFDSDEVSLKVRKAGYTLAVCRDLFIHHFGSRTFAHGAPQVHGSTAEANRAVGSSR